MLSCSKDNIENVFVEDYNNGFSYVDLKLPSGLMWGKCNVGANYEYEYGDYFMFGSLIPFTDSVCVWSKVPYNEGHYTFNLDSWNSNKNDIIDTATNQLLFINDAARSFMGGLWRLPSADEFKELFDNTSQKCDTINGHVGLRFTSKVNENYIFIPLAGIRDSIKTFYTEQIGYLRSSTIVSDTPKWAYTMTYDRNHVVLYDGHSHYDGIPIRAVLSN